LEKSFAFDDGQTSWEWVINLAGETKYSLSEEVYEERVYNLSVNIAKQAAKCKAGVFIEVSTGQVYDADKVCITIDNLSSNRKLQKKTES
jgi:hypothetical protein